MDDLPDRRGMVGPDFRGPDLASWSPVAPQPFAPQPVAPQPVAPQPVAPQPLAPQPPGGGALRPGSRLPAIVTAVAVFLVAVVVTAGTVVAHYSDTHVAAPVVPLRPALPLGQSSPDPAAPSNSSPPDRVDLLTDEGTGQLVLLDWTWSHQGRRPPGSGDYLQVQVELTCSSGVLEYGPNYFEAFDDAGHQVAVTADGVDGPELDVGTLETGQSVRGAIAFDLRFGDATLLISDGLGQPVAALRISQ